MKYDIIKTDIIFLMIPLCLFVLSSNSRVKLGLYQLYLKAHPSTLTARYISQLQRPKLDIALDKFGIGRYITETHKQPVDSNPKFGDLFCFNIRNELYTVVKVTNATQEYDGSFKHHYLRVKNGIRTAHEAVAWTFDMTTEEYNPDIET